MRAYAINRFCWMVERDPELRQRLQTDPEAALEPFGLDPEARRAVLAGDVAALYRMGAHAYLMGHLRRYGLFGLTREVYDQRIRTAAAK